jgi:prepilin-type N-terminal cleavage/methylation domain-containing protein
MRGFTLIEMLVVLAIIVIITAIVFSSQTSFNNTVIVSDTAYDVALTIRNTENAGIASQAIGSIENGKGVHFSNVLTSSFLTFTDMPSATPCHSSPTQIAGAPDAYTGDCVYDSPPDTSQIISIGNGVTISDFCAHLIGATSWSCATASGTGLGTKIFALDITSVRADTNFTMAVNGSATPTSLADEACLKLIAASGVARYILINESGQISPQSTICVPGVSSI